MYCSHFCGNSHSSPSRASTLVRPLAYLSFGVTISPNLTCSLFNETSLLHGLERQIITSLVWLDDVASAQSLSMWSRPTRESRRYAILHLSSHLPQMFKYYWFRIWDAAIESLKSLHLIHETNDVISINSTFRTNFRISIQGGYVPPSNLSIIRKLRR